MVKYYHNGRRTSKMFKTYKHETAGNARKTAAARALLKPAREELQRDVSIMRRILEETGEAKPPKYLPRTIPGSTRLSERYRQCLWDQARAAWNSYTAQLEAGFKQIVRDAPGLTVYERTALYRVNKRRAWYAHDLVLNWSRGEKGEYCYPRKGDPDQESVPVDRDLFYLARRIAGHVRRRREPDLSRVETLRLNVNVASVEDEVSGTMFKRWVRLSTLERGKPVLIPLKTNTWHEANAGRGELRRSIQLSFKEGRLTIGLVREEPDAPLRDERDVVGVDWGICSMFATSTGRLYGRAFMDWLRDADEAVEDRRRECARTKTPLKTDPVYQRLNRRIRDRARNEACRVVNLIITDRGVETLAVEDLDFRGGGLSRRMNRILTRAGRAAVTAKLARVRESHGVTVDAVNPAYTSQECSNCSFTGKENRREQAWFECQACGRRLNADVNAARVIRGRSLDGCAWTLTARRVILQELQQRYAAVAEERPWAYRAHGTARGTPPLTD
jgi:putative transposase